MTDRFDPAMPSAARIYDYFLGGSTNFAVDREVAEQLMRVAPIGRPLAHANRAFLRRTVHHLAITGIDQFLDLGAGIPTVGSVREVAGAVNPMARVVHVDQDPVAVTLGESMSAGVETLIAIGADLREPERLLADPRVRRFLDFDRPIGLLLLCVLHFVPDDPRRSIADVVAAYLSAMVPGSHVVISHLGAGPEITAAQQELDRWGLPELLWPRSVEQIREMFGATRLLAPGVVRLPQWRPEHALDVPDDLDGYVIYGGVGER